MRYFAALFASGRAIDLVLIFMAAEAIVLVALRRRGVIEVLIALAPGALLALALRAALRHQRWEMEALFLAASLPAHLADLRRRGF